MPRPPEHDRRGTAGGPWRASLKPGRMADGESAGRSMAGAGRSATIGAMRQMAVFAACAALLAAVSTGCGVDLAAEEVHAAQSFPFTGTDLKINASLGGVRVLQGTGGAVQVERWVRGKAADAPAWSLRDGTLRLSADCNLVFGDCGARYHVRVPPGVRLSIDVVDGLILNGLTQDVAARSRERIEVTGASGRLRLRSDGSITAEGSPPGTCAAAPRTGPSTWPSPLRPPPSTCARATAG
ncbi:hypothetical protein ACFQQB_32405 [Nonomuraea rubra]|uniref:hypothetical protein n=1 Tax=Nonomuraea rubra TaxID=46180 RepID=UPI00360BE6CF